MIQSLLLLIKTCIYLLTYFYVWARMCCGLHSVVRAQLAGTSSFPSCGSWGLTSGRQAWQQAPLSAVPVFWSFSA